MFKKKKDTIRLIGNIDMSTKPAEIRIQPTTGDPWVDFGYWLEVTGFMAKQAMLAQNWDEKKIKSYIQEYLDRTISDYSVEK